MKIMLDRKQFEVFKDTVEFFEKKFAIEIEWTCTKEDKKFQRMVFLGETDSFLFSQFLYWYSELRKKSLVGEIVNF